LQNNAVLRVSVVFARLRLAGFAAAFGLLGLLGTASAQSYDGPPVPPLDVGGGYAASAPYRTHSAPAPAFAAAHSDIPRPPADIGNGATPADYTGSIRQPSPTTPGRASVIAALPPDEQPETGPAQQLPPQFRRQLVSYPTSEPAGTIIIDTPHTYLYLVRGNGKALRYGIGVGREGFTWSGTERISRMSEWPDWHPPKEMIERQPYLPRFMAGGAGNPLGARALYLGSTLYRIHGTNQPSTIGHFVSSGCIRLTNEDVADLYSRIGIGTRVVVLPGSLPYAATGQAPATR
jgi:lipoprotein-anchoring transpeptidase ErfK/SrfK